MMTKNRICLVLSIICIVFIQMAASPVYGAVAITPIDLDFSNSGIGDDKKVTVEGESLGNVGVCGYDNGMTVQQAIDNPFMRDRVYPGLTKRIVSCLESTVLDIAENHIDATTQQFRTLITAVITLYLVILSIRIAFGDVKVLKSDIITGILGIGAIMYGINNGGIVEYLNIFLDAQREIVEFAIGSIQHIGTYKDELGADQSFECHNWYQDPWQRVDCILAFYLGVDADKVATMAGMPGPEGMAIGAFDSLDSDDPDERFITSLAPFLIMFGMSFTAYGPYVLLLGFAIPFLLIAGIAQAVMIYITSMMVIVFLALVAPVVMPTILFKPTKSIFDFWLQMLFSYTVQPAIVMAYLAFMITLLSVLFEGKYLGFGDMPMKKLNELVNVNKDDWETRAGQKQILRTIVSTSGVRLPANYAVENQDNIKDEDEGGNTDISARSVDGPNVILDILGGSPDVDGDGIHNYYDGLGMTPEDRENLENQGKDDFIFNLFAMFVMLSLLMGFMANVINFGASLAGLTASPLAAGTNFYNAAMSRLKV